MLKRAKEIFFLIMGTTVGAYVVNILWKLWEYNKNPDFYEIGSAPWYTGIVLITAAFGALLCIELIVYDITKRKIDKKTKATTKEALDEISATDGSEKSTF